ncbi:MAG: hypothetical protein ACKVOK_08990 [Flavobacteriales bacterium]
MKSTDHFHTFVWLRKGYIYIALLVSFCTGCSKKIVQETTRELHPLSCGYPQAHHERRLYPELTVSYEIDSLADTTLRFASNEMFTPLDSAFSRGNLSDYFVKNLAYPEMLRELEIQGNWFYSMNFENGIFTSYKLLKSPADSRLMEVEIEKQMKKQLNSLKYTTGGNNKLVLRFRVELKDP